jgi:hypothetical protein
MCVCVCVCVYVTVCVCRSGVIGGLIRLHLVRPNVAD